MLLEVLVILLSGRDCIGECVCLSFFCIFSLWFLINARGKCQSTTDRVQAHNNTESRFIVAFDGYHAAQAAAVFNCIQA